MSPPAFQEYAANWLGDRKFRRMSLAERGLLFSLRLELWVNKSIPSSITDIAEELRLSAEDVSMAFTDSVRSFLYEDNGLLTCPALEEYRSILSARREALSRGGARGGKKTQQRNKDVREQARLQAEVKPLSLVSSSPNIDSLGSLSKEEFQEWSEEFSRSPMNR